MDIITALIVVVTIVVVTIVVLFYLIKTKNSRLTTQIHNAVANDNYEKVSQLIHAGKDVNAISSRHGKHGGWTPLHQVKSTAIANLLIDSGANVNALSEHGWTPLYFKCKTFNGLDNEFDVIETFIENGAKRGISLAEDDATTIESTLMAFGKTDLMEKLIENESFGLARTSLHIAAGLGDAQKVKRYLDKGGDINATDMEGITPLFMALLENQVDVAKLLLEQDIDVNIPDKDGSRPLSAAAGMGDQYLVKTMISKGSIVNYQENDGWSPLHYACHLGHSAIVKILLESGADPNLKDSKGLTPIDYAADHGYAEIKNMLTS
jgi:ankyrin repeat protein